VQNRNYSRDKLLPEAVAQTDLLVFTLKDALKVVNHIESVFLFFLNKI
jgi:hypothetical protein